jgi:predicted O-linked N-acetylglucosamine transferase (SPINDLY family)
MTADERVSTGRHLLAGGRFADAAQMFQDLVRQRPGDADAQFGLAEALHGLAQFERSVESYRQALALRPDAVVAARLGVALCQANRLREAIPAFETALSLNPALLDARINLGMTRSHLGEAAAGIRALRQAAALKPDHADGWLVWSTVAFSARRLAEADATTSRALALSPYHVTALGLRSLVLRHAGQLASAYRLARLATTLDPGQAEMLAVAAVALRDVGLAEDAVRYFRRALAAQPRNAAIRAAFIMCLNYVDSATPADLLAEARLWQRWHAPPPRSPAPAPVRHDRPLRVGLVSGDLRRHAVGFFLAGALPVLDSSRVRISCFTTSTSEDALTARLRMAAAAWHDISRMNDEVVFTLVRREAIDVLVDMSGYTAGARLELFATRPAPVQAAWIGYFGTTGLSAIDWLIADRHLVPPGDERFFSERVLRLPDSYVCYAPPVEAPAVMPSPSDRAGHVTFGCCNALAKVTRPTIALWARILHGVPGARLLLKAGAFEAAAARRQIESAFALHDIGAERLLLEGWSPYPAFLDTYGRIDVALDPFPFCGGLTSVETLWMGVPLVSLAGDRFAGRQSLSYLATIGHGDLCAASPEAYVALAVSLGHDAEKRRRLRACLRSDMAGSPLLDGSRFARNLEAAFKTMADS